MIGEQISISTEDERHISTILNGVERYRKHLDRAVEVAHKDADKARNNFVKASEISVNLRQYKGPSEGLRDFKTVIDQYLLLSQKRVAGIIDGHARRQEAQRL